MGDFADAVRMHYTALPKGLFGNVSARNRSEEPTTREPTSFEDDSSQDEERQTIKTRKNKKEQRATTSHRN